MKASLTVLLAFCVALGVGGGLNGLVSPGRSCPRMAGQCPSHKAAGERPPAGPCAASCPVCAGAGTANLSHAWGVSVTWMIDARPADVAWAASRLTYPPPLPPPRFAAG